MSDTTLGEILQAHRVERLGFPGMVKCHACDGWTEGTIHDHHADLARAFFAAHAAEETLRPVLHEVWLAIHVKRFDKAQPDSLYNGTLRAQFEVERIAREQGIERVYDHVPHLKPKAVNR